MDVNFQCTKCGNCCKGLRLPLSVDEAVDWLSHGNPVQVLCEAIVWADEPPNSNLHAAFKRERSFPAISGELPIRVLVTLAAPLGDGCPNLASNNLCNLYEDRPQVCRIYPAELNPFLELAIEHRRCPPDAWQVNNPLIRNSAYVDSELRLLMQARLNRTILDVPFQENLCAILNIHVAAMANEGYAAHSPDRADLLEALLACKEQKQTPGPLQNWKFISDRIETMNAIWACDAECLFASEYQPDAFEYLSLFVKMENAND